MKEKSFSLQIGSLNFNSKSLGYIVAGLFLQGVLMGFFSSIHIDNPEISSAVTMPLMWVSIIISIAIVVKGLRKATVVD